MANLLVMMEFFRGELLPASIEALGQARRLGTAFGLSVYALVPLPSEPDSGDEDITARCGRYGADKVVMLTGEGLQNESEMRFAGYSGALLAACAQLPPRLLFIGDTPAARDIAPRLASRLGAAYLPRGAVLEVNGELLLYDETGSQVSVDAELQGMDGVPPSPPPPVLLTVPPGRFEFAASPHDAEMLIVAAADSVPTSDATPVAAIGFTEEGLDTLPLAHRLCGSGPQDASPAIPPLWRVRAISGDLPVEFDCAQYQIALGPYAEQDAAADYALTVPEADIAVTRATLLAQLALPAPPKPVLNRASPGSLGERSQGTPTGRFDGWDDADITLTGDADTTREIIVPPLVARPPDEPVRAPTPAPVAPPAAVKSPLPVPQIAASAGGWGEFAGTPSAGFDDVDDLASDGTPQFELETADTAPVAIVTLVSEGIGGSAARSGPIGINTPTVRRGTENKPRSSQSPRRAAPSMQSPGRGRGAGPRKSKDPSDPTGSGGGPAGGPGSGPGRGRTEDP